MPVINVVKWFRPTNPTGTESELRVDVFVDTITKIAIRTTSLELLLEETPSTFGIVAYDDDGNVVLLLFRCKLL